MKKRPLPGDTSLRAKMVVDLATDSIELPQKDLAAVELGRRGGLKGGRARAEKLSPEERSEIARKAALARWGVHRE